MKFENELGNEITLEVIGTDAFVEIIMEGPDSMSSNLITRVEGQKLYECLKEIFGE